MTKAPKSTILLILLACGALASVIYVIIDLIGAASYPGYKHAAQAISEMSAVGAPTADLLAPYYHGFSILFVAFAVGVYLAGSRQHALRRSAAFMFAVASVGTGLSRFRMNMRGAARTFSDTMHLIVAAAAMVLLSGAMLSASKAFVRSFSLYSQSTVAIMVALFVLTLGDAAAVAANAPTGLMGIAGRICVGAWLPWIFILSLKLLKERGFKVSEPQPAGR